jgi:hypothetical protein
MRIVAYCITFNEEDVLPYYLRHYEGFCDKIVVFDNMSTDRTPAIASRHPKVELRLWDSGGRLDERLLLAIKNNCYREERGRADWVIVGDVDELVYHRDIREFLSRCKRQGVSLPAAVSYDMISRTFPVTTGQIYEEVKEGVPSRVSMQDVVYAKHLLFDPVLDINYAPGCHYCDPRPEPVGTPTPELTVLHMKYLSPERLLERCRVYEARLSEFNKEMGWGAEYRSPDNSIRDYFEEVWAARQPVPL